MEESKEETPATEEKREEPTEPTEEEELKEEALEEKPEEIEEPEKAEEKEGEKAPAEEAKAEEIPAPVEEEEVKPPEKKKKAEEEEIVEERTYTVPLGKALIVPANKRAARAMRMLRSFIIKHMKLEARKEGTAEEEEEPTKLIITNEVNQKVWERGIEKPPRKIRVRAAKDKEGNVTVYLAEGD